MRAKSLSCSLIRWFIDVHIFNGLICCLCFDFDLFIRCMWIVPAAAVIQSHNNIRYVSIFILIIIYIDFDMMFVFWILNFSLTQFI